KSQKPESVGDPPQGDGHDPSRDDHYRNGRDIHTEQVDFREPHQDTPASKKVAYRRSTSESARTVPRACNTRRCPCCAQCAPVNAWSNCSSSAAAVALWPRATASNAGFS